jgi:hypothetical protein
MFLLGSENTVGKKRSTCLQELQVRTIKAKLKVVSGPLPTYVSSATIVKYTYKKFCKYNFYLFRLSITPTLHWATIDGAKKSDNTTKYKINCRTHVVTLHHRVVAICTSSFSIYKLPNFAQTGYLCLYCFTVHFHISISFYQRMHFYCD